VYQFQLAFSIREIRRLKKSKANMAFKFLVFIGLVAAVNCGFIGAPYATYAQAPTIVKTIAQAPTIVKQIEVQAPAQYSFQYSVNDASTGDIKSQHETRNGDDVQGSYSLVDADGLTRTVDYTASEAAGFNAVVRREGTPHPAPVVVKKVVAAPTITKVIAPAPLAYPHYAHVHHAAPAVQKVIAAPSAFHHKVIASPSSVSSATVSLSSPYANYGW
jgi:hypothetical protein